MTERGRAEQQPPVWWTLTRDIGSFLAGWVMAFLEVQRETLRESVLVFAATVVGVPVWAVGKQAVNAAVAARRGGTTDSQSQPPEEAQEGSSSRPL